ncbi:MAG: hypothetical protein M3512_04835, partial [Bacteroidota bacterium]|nr:hypothetical protein [Bacteroidota bacterium]
MITSTEIAPSFALAPFIRCYSLRRFNTGNAHMSKPWHASNDISIVYFFQDKPVHLLGPQGKVVKEGHFAGIVGNGSQFNGDMIFKGSYNFLEICFKPCGFFNLFKIPIHYITYSIFDIDVIFDSSINLLHEKLICANGLSEMAKLADSYFINYLINS